MLLHLVDEQSSQNIEYKKFRNSYLKMFELGNLGTAIVRICKLDLTSKNLGKRVSSFMVGALEKGFMVGDSDLEKAPGKMEFSIVP